MRILSVVLLFGLMATAQAESLPTARLTMSGSNIGLLIGYEQADGVMIYQDKSYPFELSGFNGVTLGYSHFTTQGVIYHLDKPDDFAGRYRALSGKVVLVQGGGSRLLKNDNGVIIELQTLDRGALLALGLGGFRITLKPKTPDNNPSQTQTVKRRTDTPGTLRLRKDELSIERPRFVDPLEDLEAYKPYRPDMLPEPVAPSPSVDLTRTSEQPADSTLSDDIAIEPNQENSQPSNTTAAKIETDTADSPKTTTKPAKQTSNFMQQLNQLLQESEQ